MTLKKEVRFITFFTDFIWRVLRTKLFEGLRPMLIRSEAYMLQGKLRISGSDFSTIFVGSTVNVEYFSNLFFIDKPNVKFLGKISFDKVASSLKTTEVDLTIVETSWLFSRFLRENGFFASPRLDFVLDITDPFKNIQKRISEGKRRNLEKVAKSNYTFEVTQDLSKLESFYYDMYLPHMLKRHSGSALPISYSELKELFSKGELLFIKSGEECISANLLVPQGNELWEPILAVKDVYKQFTLGSYAVYYFSILVGIQRGFTRMDFGETPPFMQDGLFQFKKGLGMWVRPAKGSSAQVFGLRFSNMGEVVRRFLFDNPFVFLDERGLSGLVFLESIDVLSVKPFCVSGLESLYVVSRCVDVSGLEGFKVEKLGARDFLSNNVSFSRFLGLVCTKGEYSLYRIKW
jgi:hypothetical protein